MKKSEFVMIGKKKRLYPGDEMNIQIEQERPELILTLDRLTVTDTWTCKIGSDRRPVSTVG